MPNPCSVFPISVIDAKLFTVINIMPYSNIMISSGAFTNVFHEFIRDFSGVATRTAIAWKILQKRENMQSARNTKFVEYFNILDVWMRIQGGK